MAQAVVVFQHAVQQLEPVNAAAYRMLGVATCQITSAEQSLTVTLEGLTSLTEADLRQQFLAAVTDENLRAQIAHRTDPVRNLILSLAFGALAQPTDRSA